MLQAHLFLQSAALATPLASRPFVAAFVTALCARATDLLIAPGWFVSTPSLLLLGFLCLLEVAARKSVDARELLEEIDPWLKIGVAFVVQFALVGEESAALLLTMTGGAPMGLFGLIWMTLQAVVTWFVAFVRYGVLLTLREIDEDDDLGLQGLISWLEDLGVGFGVLLALFLPVVALFLFAMTVLGLWLIRRWLDKREAESRVPCRHCGTDMLPTAPFCPSCRRPSDGPRAVSFFGGARAHAAPAPPEHRVALLSQRRCPVCAGRLTTKAVRQQCGECSTETFQSREELQAYVAAAGGKLPRTLLVCCLFSLVPVAGLIPGIIYYRVGLVASVRRWLPRGTSFFTCWGVRGLNLVLIACQTVPFFGAVMLPAMCWSNWMVYRGVLLRAGDRAFPVSQPARPAA